MLSATWIQFAKIIADKLFAMAEEKSGSLTPTTEGSIHQNVDLVSTGTASAPLHLKRSVSLSN